MDDDGDYVDFDNSYNSAGDDFGEVYGYEDDFYGGEEDEGQDSDPVEGDQELTYEEEGFADDQMMDYEEFVEEEEEEEDGEEYPAYDDQFEEDEEDLGEDQDGVQFEGEMVDFEAEEEEEVPVEEDEVFYGDGAGIWDADTLLDDPFGDFVDYEGDPFDFQGLDNVEPCPPTRPRHIYFESESSDSDDEGRGIYGSDSESSAEWLTCGKKVGSRRTKSGRSNESSWNGFQGPICPICFRRWKEEGHHCVCCLPCGHIYGMSCIKTWLERPNSQKCPQCNEVCELNDVKRLYGMQLTTPKVEELQEKVELLEAKCADLETKDADWMRKEAEWQKREAELEEQLKQHKQAEADRSEPADALKATRL